MILLTFSYLKLALKAEEALTIAATFEGYEKNSIR